MNKKQTTIRGELVNVFLDSLYVKTITTLHNASYSYQSAITTMIKNVSCYVLP